MRKKGAARRDIEILGVSCALRWLAVVRALK